MQDETIDPYKPPASSVEMIAANASNTYFFTTSTFKLAVMSICTFGLYELYWFYKNWVSIKEQTGQNIMPFWRAFFAPFWAYSCFKHIKNAANVNKIEESLSVGLLAVVYFIVQSLWRLPDPYWLISCFSFALIIPANNVALTINKQLIADFKNNDRFSGWNWVGIILGGLLFLMSLIGIFYPELGEV